MIVIDVYHHETKDLICSLDCPFKCHELAQLLQYNGYTIQILNCDDPKEPKVIDTLIAK